MRSPERAVNWLDLDRIERRFLLAACADCSILVYDTQSRHHQHSNSLLQGCHEPTHALQSLHSNGEALPTGGTHTHVPGASAAAGEPPDGGASGEVVLLVGKGHPQGHKFGVSSAVWYPVDTGLFVTGGFDGHVKLWDANNADAVCAFEFGCKIHCVAMSPVAAAHCLVAAAGQASAVQLCDPATGAFTHTLAGHRSAVIAASWSLQSEYQLLTGDDAGVVKVYSFSQFLVSCDIPNGNLNGNLKCN